MSPRSFSPSPNLYSTTGEPKPLKESHRLAQAAVSDLADAGVMVLDHGPTRDLPALISRCVERFRVYHQLLSDERIPTLRAGGRSARALAAHTVHLVEQQQVLLKKLRDLGQNEPSDLPSVREIVLSALLLTQDLEAQRHALGEITTVDNPRLSGAA